jgi:hypothetical protein
MKGEILLRTNKQTKHLLFTRQRESTYRIVNHLENHRMKFEIEVISEEFL